MVSIPKPTYNEFPEVPEVIGMPEMVSSYLKMRKQPWYDDATALKNASVIYNSKRHQFMWAMYGLEVSTRASYEQMRVRDAQTALDLILKEED